MKSNKPKHQRLELILPITKNSTTYFHRLHLDAKDKCILMVDAKTNGPDFNVFNPKNLILKYEAMWCRADTKCAFLLPPHSLLSHYIQEYHRLPLALPTHQFTKHFWPFSANYLTVISCFRRPFGDAVVSTVAGFFVFWCVFSFFLPVFTPGSQISSQSKDP